MKAGAIGLVSGVVMLAGCSSSAPQVVPTDGVHITGPINAVYTISTGGDCYLNTVYGKEQLRLQGIAGIGEPTIELVISPYAGAGTYTNLVWPPDGHSSLSVGMRGNLIFVADAGQITVTSVHGATVEGTLRATNMREWNRQTKKNASAEGSWTCQVQAPPSPTDSTPALS